VPTVSDLRRDPVTGRWVIISTEPKRPSDFAPESVQVTPDPACPFCEGHEEMTPPELFAVRRNGSQHNMPGWDLRVVPSQFPVLRVEGTLDRQGEGIFDSMHGIGAHEVIIESPRHGDTMADMSDRAIEQVFWSASERIQDLRRDHRLRSIILFKNHGAAAGASLGHSYSQIVAVPIVPREVRDEVDGARAHFAAKERCVFCDILRQETKDGRRMVAENADMVAVAPFAPRFPFETWILPRRHDAYFEHASRHEHASLARLLGDVLRRINRALGSPPYNMVVHTAPVAESADEYYHWHLEIVPKVMKVTGFEWATGLYLNPTSPEEAAQVLRAARG
jgi:UDPglucose--hexose-1-phosphate uridylyltransferase